ncbi:DUF5335 family protein [Vitiosangium sp. GDMCC 1.1324]|uniref:DUF5335 family protein n=1 Tax=Vitiosangium sp. (strain GDMCC 1.1324) TaxID=2138576 RepID=UPI000D371884|nr:DUF5335 family protein [Vitiosangium sp. GDMCC 1.1324]PTL79833.1 hypothetical protein DAT35_30810 [Vitiosangium sp. GDMCC 1.1324]
MNHMREIPREGWADYLSLLSAIERDHEVRIQAENPEFGDQTVAGSLPLVDIALEEKGSDLGAIEVTVGHPGEELTHRIAHPEHLWAEESEQGELECLDIEDSDHAKTHIYFEQEALLDEATPPPPPA